MTNLIDEIGKRTSEVRDAVRQALAELHNLRTGLEVNAIDRSLAVAIIQDVERCLAKIAD